MKKETIVLVGDDTRQPSAAPSTPVQQTELPKAETSNPISAPPTPPGQAPPSTPSSEPPSPSTGGVELRKRPAPEEIAGATVVEKRPRKPDDDEGFFAMYLFTSIFGKDFFSPSFFLLKKGLFVKRNQT